MVRLHQRWIAPLALLACGACVLAPAELKDERLRLARAGTRYSVAAAGRVLPALSSVPTYDELLRRTFLASAELEARWHEWHAAIAEVTVASAWPNTNVELSFEHVFSGDKNSVWDRTTFGIGFDPADTLELPAKTELRGRVALAAARSSAERFRTAKFALERRFTEGFVDWMRAHEEAAAAERALTLLRTAKGSAERAAAASPNALGIVRGRIEIAASENELERLRAEVSRARAAVLSLAHLDDVALEPTWPDLVSPSVDDATWIALAARSNPKLNQLAHELAGRADALELARAAWWPDLAPLAGFTGSVTQFVGATLSIPTQTARIRADVEASRARLDGVRALSDQGSIDVRAGVVADLIALREAERALRSSNEVLQPLAHQLSNAARAAYAGGTASQLEWLDALRAENAAKTAEIAARAARETSLARLQEWVGVDLASITNDEGGAR